MKSYLGIWSVSVNIKKGIYSYEACVTFFMYCNHLLYLRICILEFLIYELKLMTRDHGDYVTLFNYKSYSIVVILTVRRDSCPFKYVICDNSRISLLLLDVS